MRSTARQPPNIAPPASWWASASRRRAVTLATPVLMVVLVLAGTRSASRADARPAERDPTARTARTLDATSTAKLHLVKAEGSDLFEEGPVTGAIAGSMRASLSTGATFTGSFAIHTRNGSIDGRGVAVPHGAGRYQSFSGTFLVTGGSGRYAHVKGRGGLYGVFDRRSDSVVVQTTGKLSY